MEESLKKLRKPTTQVVNVLSLIMILMGLVQYFYSLTIESTPIYLIITTVIEIIVILFGFTQLFEKETDIELKTAKRYLIIGCLTGYTTYLSFYNAYFFMAEENNYDLSKFWIVGFVFLLVCASAHICKLLLMASNASWVKGNKYIWIMVLSVIASTIYVQKIVEYILIPNVAESHFVIIISMIMIFVGNSLATQFFLHYGEVYIAIENKCN
ncbi:DUF5079 family protein [Staphylococcus pasteuri]|uniref:DUF5079 family protein n=1 Tax=Staphylococcus pasteuri TaxID=45972 RepID=UPI001E2E1388|nr:DUF5079 family protein [Staphylococcus pasteuri]MCD9066722.1 DUF5079 family protein [Staphylococcus pasteuri]WAE41916.1 DUF5079 family protein [Staphylococcus pasteuri]